MTYPELDSDKFEAYTKVEKWGIWACIAIIALSVTSICLGICLF